MLLFSLSLISNYGLLSNNHVLFTIRTKTNKLRNVNFLSVILINWTKRIEVEFIFRMGFCVSTFINKVLCFITKILFYLSRGRYCFLSSFFFNHETIFILIEYVFFIITYNIFLLLNYNAFYVNCATKTTNELNIINQIMIINRESI